MFDVPKQFEELQVQACMKALKANGMEAVYFPNKEAAVNEVLHRIPEGATVGAGGSVTLRQLELLDILRQRGHTVFDHWKEGYGDPRSPSRRAQLTADIFLTSTNAVTLDGKLLNTDGTGNRVASMFFGPPTVIVVAGVNKIVADLDEAFQRMKNVAAPMNGMRLSDKRKYACSATGECIECDDPGRMCKITVIIEKKPPAATQFIVFLVGEALGY
ncbi:MAG: lactate utilization protein [Deltaproteobacteria bacterium]|nr:lactate utilization protein [Deltaproteobacteria bacterium]MBW2306186.1 lactate utilization protein [Deltaproteobacteria bacterium]